MAARRALITGVTGQDGSLLAELLLENGYEVYGVVPPERHADAAGEVPGVQLVDADLLDPVSIRTALAAHRPHELYNLASITFVPASWEQPLETAELAAVGTTGVLEAIRSVDPKIRFFQASSAEVFGIPKAVPQNESTPVAPVTPYGAAKAYAQFITQAYRRRYRLHASVGILFNHESPRRPGEFVTRKITRGVADIRAGEAHELMLGDVDARRDWGYAGDFVRAMWQMLQQDEPDDYVIATGASHSVREFAELAFAHAGLDWRQFIRVDEKLMRGAADSAELVGDPTKARDRFGWKPSVSFEDLVALMVDADLENVAAGRPPAHATGTNPA